LEVNMMETPNSAHKMIAQDKSRRGFISFLCFICRFIPLSAG
jgi:hypothetical protein